MKQNGRGAISRTKHSSPPALILGNLENLSVIPAMPADSQQNRGYRRGLIGSRNIAYLHPAGSIVKYLRPVKTLSEHPYNGQLFHPFGFDRTVLELNVDKFDYAAPAELFPSRNRKIASKVKYRRFDTAAEALRFAMEELPEALLLGAYIEVDEKRLGHQDIRALYESELYPLKKKKAA